MSVPIFTVDAFTDRPFAGNPAGVCLLEAARDEDWMRSIAAEMNHAETAFLVPHEGDGFDLRWFTPTVEVALCGHATLASGHVLLERDAPGLGGERVTFRTRKAGVLEVRRAGPGYELALPVTRMAPTDNATLIAALGCEGECFESVSGAEATAIVLLPDEAAVRALDPDLRALASLDLMAICTAPAGGGASAAAGHRDEEPSDGDADSLAEAIPEPRPDVVSRVFAPAWGVDEDSVTGSAHAALTPFWAERLGRDRFTAHQASTRGGDLTCRLEGDCAWLGGQCVTVVEGRFFLP